MDVKGRPIKRDRLPKEVYHTTQTDSEEDSADYVKWQGSQTACLALNQLIKSSANETKVETQVVDEGVSTQRGWQRQPSFDQIPGFSLLGLNTDDSPGFNSQASSSSSKSVRPSLARTRSSTFRQRSPMIPPDVTNLELPIPFLDKANPLSFMDMLKGVSARLDENAGVNAAKSSTKATKRTRRSSLGIASETRQVKKGRVSASDGLESNAIRALDKGKARHIYTNDTGKELFDDVIPLVKDDNKGFGTSSTVETQRSFATSSIFSRTASQTKMPPPLLLPNKPPDPATVSEKRSIITSSKLSSPSPSRTTTRSVSRNNHLPTDSKPAKLYSGPKLHPLLLEQQAKSASTSTSTSSSKALTPPTSSRAASIATATKVHILHSTVSTKALPPNIGGPIPGSTDAPFPSSTPTMSNSQSSRPPALGMRRTNATASSTGMATALQTTGSLPSRRKGFKPPLLSGSQTPLSQVASSSQQPTTSSRASTSTAALQQPQSRYASAKHAEIRHTSSSGSASSDSLRASSSSSSSASRPASSASPSSSSQSPPPPKTKAGAASTTATRGNNFVSARSTAQGAAAAVSVPIPIPASPTLPEPLDGDGDSSFGDLSFDMDALEETMRMYD